VIIHDQAAFEGALPIAALPPLPAFLTGPDRPARLKLLAARDLGVADHARWDALGDDAGTGSVFAQPWFTRAGIAHCRGGANAMLAVVCDDDGEWIGAIPVVPRLRYGKAPFPHWAAWSHPNQFRGDPLVRRGQAVRFWRALLAGLDGRGFGRLALRLTGLPLGEETTLALMRVCCEDMRPCKIDAQYSRPLLLADKPEDADVLKGSLRRRIASLERKVERELGPLGWRVTSAQDDIDAGLARFLVLEGAGWKGQAGSALASAAATRGFFAAITAEAARRGQIEVTELLAGDRVLAASVHFTGREQGFGYKMAYDEALGAYGPGLLLMQRLTAHFRAHFRGQAPARIDSCCAPGQEPIGSLWPERLHLVDCGVALGRGVRRQGLDWLDRAEAIYRRVPAGTASA